jgi:hypothetical protein
LCDLHRDRAGSDKIALEARENLTERLEAAGQQNM